MTVTPMPLGSGSKIPAREDRDWVTSAEVVAESGITYRQFDYWCRTGLLTALPAGKVAHRTLIPNTPGSGYLRRFDETQVDRARTLADLLDLGFSLQRCRECIDDLLSHDRIRVGLFTLTRDKPTA